MSLQPTLCDQHSLLYIESSISQITPGLREDSSLSSSESLGASLLSHHIHITCDFLNLFFCKIENDCTWTAIIRISNNNKKSIIYTKHQNYAMGLLWYSCFSPLFLLLLIAFFSFTFLGKTFYLDNPTQTLQTMKKLINWFSTTYQTMMNYL